MAAVAAAARVTTVGSMGLSEANDRVQLLAGRARAVSRLQEAESLSKRRPWRKDA